MSSCHFIGLLPHLSQGRPLGSRPLWSILLLHLLEGTWPCNISLQAVQMLIAFQCQLPLIVSKGVIFFLSSKGEITSWLSYFMQLFLLIFIF